MNEIEQRRQDRFWNQLIGTISKGNVVPIVGEELLRIPGTNSNLYQLLAERYAKFCNLELNEEQQGNLSATVRSNPEFRDNPHDIYQEVADEYLEWAPPIPEPLRSLAKIRHFNLFISTTFDDLLEQDLIQLVDE